MLWCFLGILRYLKRAKPKIFLNLWLESGANCGLSWLPSFVALGAYIRLFGACWRASAQVVLHPCKIAAFGYPCAIAFLDCFNKSVLRHFLGGFFGFIGARGIFGYLVAFVGLVGLYACNVRRLRTEKRKPRKFIGLLRSYVFSSCVCCCFACLDCFAPGLCAGCVFFVGLCCWCLSFPSDDCDKKKGRAFRSSSLCSWVVVCCYSLANCSRASCHTFSASSGFSPQLFQCWRLAP